MQSQKEYLSLLLKQAEKSLEDFNKNHSSYNDEELNWKPGPESWSIGEVFEHIIQSNSLYYSKFDEIINSQNRLSDGEDPPFKHTFMGKMIIKAIHPDNVKKTKTAKVFEPAASRVGQDIFEIFADQHKRLIDFIRRSDRVNLSKVKLSSPVGKFIRYNIGDAYGILVYHTERHLNQIGRVNGLFKSQATKNK